MLEGALVALNQYKVRWIGSSIDRELEVVLNCG